MIKKLEATLKNFGKVVEQAQQKYVSDTKNIKENYAGSLLQQLLTQTTAEHEKSVYELRVSTQKSINEVVEQLYKKVDTMATTSNPEALAQLSALRGMKLTAGELEALAGKYGKDYMGMKLLSTIAGESGLRLLYTSVDDLKENVSKIEETSKSFVKTYSGDMKNASYKERLISVVEHPFADYDEMFDNSSISIVNKPRAELTPEQKTTLKSLFDGHDDIELRFEQLKELGLPDVDRLRADYFVMVSEGEID